MHAFNMSGPHMKGDDIIKRNKDNIKMLDAYNRELIEIQRPKTKQIVIGSRFLIDAKKSS